MMRGPDDEDVRRVVPRWEEAIELVEGAVKRGWTAEQIDYLRACIGVTWAKAFRAGEKAEMERSGESA